MAVNEGVLHLTLPRKGHSHGNSIKRLFNDCVVCFLLERGHCENAHNHGKGSKRWQAIEESVCHDDLDVDSLVGGVKSLFFL